MQKNTAGKIVVFAYGLPNHTNPGEPITGDALNITANLRIDGAAANPVDDVNPAELEGGYYIFDITAVESNGNLLLLAPTSTTANVQVIAVPAAVYTTPLNFNALGIAADGDISGDVDGNVDGSVATLINLPAIAANWLTATGIAANALNGKGDWNIGKGGYALTQVFPANFADLAIAITTGKVTVGTNDDKTGYSISGTISTLDGLNNFNPTTQGVGLSAGVHTGAIIPTVITLDGHTPQTGDGFLIVNDGTFGNSAIKTSVDSLIASPGTGARPFIPTAITVVAGLTPSGSADDLANDDGAVYTVNDNAGTLTLDLEYQLTADTEIIQFLMVAAAQGNTDNLTLQIYNDVGAVYVDFGTLTGVNGLTYATFDKIIVAKYTSDLGLFKVRITGTGLTSATLTIDKAVAFGIAQADGITNGSTLTLGADSTNTNFIGHNWTLALNNSDVSNAYIFGANVSGIAITPAGKGRFENCDIGVVTSGESNFLRCRFGAIFTAGGAGDYFIEDSKSSVAGAGSCEFDFSAVTAITTLSARNQVGGGVWRFNAFCTASIEVLAGGTHTITTGGGNIEFRGAPKQVNIVTSGAGVTNIVIWSGCPIAISGTGGTVNIYGLHGKITNTATNTTVNKEFGADITDITTIQQDADLIKYQDQIVYIDTEQVAIGNGSARAPFSTIADGLDFAENNNIRQIVFLADATLDRNLKNFRADGLGLSVLDLNGHNTASSAFERIILTGHNSAPSFWSVLVGGFQDGLSGVQGGHIDINITGEVTLAANGASLFTNLAPAHVPGLPAPALIMPTGAFHKSILSNLSGDLLLKGFDSALHDMNIAMNGGVLTIDNSCSAGVIVVTGTGKVISNATGTSVNIDGMVKDLVWDNIL